MKGLRLLLGPLVPDRLGAGGHLVRLGGAFGCQEWGATPKIPELGLLGRLPKTGPPTSIFGDFVGSGPGNGGARSMRFALEPADPQPTCKLSPERTSPMIDIDKIIPKVRRWADGSIMPDHVFENEPDEA